MKYINTKDKEEVVDFKSAVLNGMAKHRGLYVPDSVPQMSAKFWSAIGQMTNAEIAFEVLKPYVTGCLTDDQLQKIVTETVSFKIPLVKVEDGKHILELFHGPTQAFKDVGARFMSRCLAAFSDGKPTLVLVATSGDTGSAVAHGFYNVPGVNVRILYPKGKVSAYQEHQMTSLGGNIEAVAIDGTFDDCQRMVKDAFADEQLNKEHRLSSANSINVARLLPQMLYYFFAYRDFVAQSSKEMVVSVPSGNFGNLSAGVLAKLMGLPIKRFIAGTNANSVFVDYLTTGTYEERSSVKTHANAMDVGAPSNFDRLMHFFESDVNQVKSLISAGAVSDEEILDEMREVKSRTSYLLDPHAAVGFRAAHVVASEELVVLGTADPVKFQEVVDMM